jgi:hypothetical protein
MSSRAEEKERRRKEREEAERKLRAQSDRRKRMSFVGGGVLVAAIAVIIVLAVASGGDEGSNQTVGDVAVPARQISDLKEAADAAGCTVKSYPDEGRGHTGETVTYKTNPPTSGAHNPVPADDGIYAAGNTPAKEALVHSLEHGRILIQYKPGTPASTVNQLETLFNEEVKGTQGYHTLLLENNTKMTAAIAATSWKKALTCPAMNDKVFDAIRAFRVDNVDKAPEFIP